MTTQETSALMEFYHVTAIEDWTCTNVIKHYRAKLENKDQKTVLDNIKKDLVRVTKSSEFDIAQQEKAQKIIDDWKNWASIRKDLKRSSDIKVGRLQVKKIKNFATATGGSTQFVDSNISYGKCCQDVDKSDDDDDFMPMPIRKPKRKNLSLSKNKELAGSKKANTMNITSSSPAEPSSSSEMQAETEREQPLKSPGLEFQEKKAPEKSKKRQVCARKSELLSSLSSDELEVEDGIEDENEKVEFDINIIVKQLEMQPTVEWKVDNINVSQRFRQFQQIAIDKLKKNGLKWDDTFEILALSSIIVLSSPCPYPNFTNLEWHKIIQTNPYQLRQPIIPPSISNALLEASRKHVVGEDSYMHPERSELSRAAARVFNDLQELPTLSDKKLSENKHCCRLLHPYVNPLFFGPLKEYETRLDRSVNGTRKRPDISCIVNGTPILNSEIKPLGYTPLQKKKDSVKVQLRAKKSVNEQLNIKGGPGEAAILMNMGDVLETFFMDLKFSGLYRSWTFHTTRLAIDKPSMPLTESTFCHFVALERKVNELAENFKSRKVPFTPPLQILSFMNEITDSPQIKRLFGK